MPTNINSIDNVGKERTSFLHEVEQFVEEGLASGVVVQLVQLYTRICKLVSTRCMQMSLDSSSSSCHHERKRKPRGAN